MTIESELKLSYFREISDLKLPHGVTLVQHTHSNRLYVKKVTTTYNLKVYNYLQRHPVPGLPKICELIEEDGSLTIIEDYINGESLDEMISRRGKIPEEETIRIISQLCDTVDVLHSFNPPIIHRDIKPDNIIITPDGSAVLLDMNAARFDDGTDSKDTVLLGTAGYAAPEQYGFGASKASADIYALGMLMNTMLTGNLSRDRIAPGYPGKVIRRCIELNPRDRFSSVHELKQAVHKKATRMRYLPPGFRSGNPLHMILSMLMYCFIFVTLAGLAESGSGPIVTVIEITGFIAGYAVLVAFTFNYLNFRRKTAPFLYRYNPTMRAIMIALIDVVIAITFIVIIVLISMAVTHLFGYEP